jgi:ribosomal protein S18 acetylase RimI-like enzyme
MKEFNAQRLPFCWYFFTIILCSTSQLKADASSSFFDKQGQRTTIEWHNQTNEDHALFDSLKELYVASFEKPEQEFYNNTPDIPLIETESTAAYLAESWRWETLTNNQRAICVCCYNEHRKIIGFSFFVIDSATPERCTLAWIGVHPEYQHRGLSKKLISSIFTIHPELTQILLYTFKTNTIAQAAYFSFGFTPIQPEDFGLEVLPYSTYFLYTRQVHL